MRNRASSAIFARARVAFAALAVLLISGCASVSQQADNATPSTPATPGASTGAPKGGRDVAPQMVFDRSLHRAPTVPAEAPLPVVELNDGRPLAPVVDLTLQSDDLFERLRMGFAMPDIRGDLVLYQEQWYLNRPDYLRRMVERSRLYLYHIVDELDKRGMPTELALLPMVESAFNPMAYSRAKASGLWQFIPSTGKRYQLDQDWWKDERRDIVASTSAALDYLQSIYDMHGDWHLALASYNWGEGAVARAIAKNRAQGLPTDYLSLTMPRETRNYVPKLQALKNIFGNPKLVASLDLPTVPNRPYFEVVTPSTNIDVKVAARLAGMPVQEFVALNPAHNRPVIKSDTSVVIPADKLDAFMNKLEEHTDGNKPLSSWQSYTLKPNDKLETVAARHGMTVATLKSVNGIKGKNRPKPGTTLLVAAKGSGETPSMAALPEQPRTPEPPVAARKGGPTHLVRKGETLPQIARKHGLTVAELKRLNGLTGDALKPGTRLTLAAPDRDKARVAARSEPATEKATEKTAATRVTHYTIRVGDTLASIARQFKVAIDDLMRWNKVTPKSLQPGQTLKIVLAQNP